jgi:hypothetical protein
VFVRVRVMGWWATLTPQLSSVVLVLVSGYGDSISVHETGCILR